jgi:hypothetical protein
MPMVELAAAPTPPTARGDLQCLDAIYSANR